MTATPPDRHDPCRLDQEPPCRRSVLRAAALSGVALPLLAACGGGSGDGGSGGSGSGGGGGGDGSGGGGGGGAATVPAASVPVGGGRVLADQQVVVTQPAKGQFKAFTAVCTHQGCTVGKVQGGKIICPCHGSEFSIKDGHNVQGPNGSPAGSVADLAEKKVSVSGGQVSVSG
jgi:nitrite reductase/ring-hydroxylating ferredoxin subunit